MIGVGARRVLPAVIFCGMAVFAVLVASVLVERHAVAELSRSEARQVSQLVFQGIYALMRNGAGKDDIEAAIAAMSETHPGLSIKVHRGESMIRDPAAPAEEGDALSAQPILAQVLTAESEAATDDSGDIRFVYPLKVRTECPTCHTRSKVGDLGGVIEVTYPVAAIRSVVGQVVNAVVAALALAAALFALGLYAQTRLAGRFNRMVYRRSPRPEEG